jgi:hypothetical protein
MLSSFCSDSPTFRFIFLQEKCKKDATSIGFKKLLPYNPKIISLKTLFIGEKILG